MENGVLISYKKLSLFGFQRAKEGALKTALYLDFLIGYNYSTNTGD